MVRVRATEHQIQSAFVQWCRFQAIKDSRFNLLFAIPNQQGLGPRYLGKLKKEGYEAGVPDLFFSHPTYKYHGLYLEAKSEAGRLSVEQGIWRRRLVSAGYLVEEFRSLDEGIKIVTEYLT